jgi:hypothetical protein
LSTEQGDRLYQTQEKAINDAMPKCMNALRPDEAMKVSIVLSIGSDGKAVEAWTKQNSNFAKCVEKLLLSKSYILPPTQPFYTSLDLNIGIKRAP